MMRLRAAWFQNIVRAPDIQWLMPAAGGRTPGTRAATTGTISDGICRRSGFCDIVSLAIEAVTGDVIHSSHLYFEVVSG
jgi:hypothetical protein